MKKKSWLSLILLCLSFYLSKAQSQLTKIDDLISFCQENGMFNGHLLVSENGKVIYQRSVGLADFEQNISINDHTSFCLGSI
ncbi:MAG: hypothetical protein AB3N14_00715 [Flavobacteriaceae bacterium]